MVMDRGRIAPGKGGRGVSGCFFCVHGNDVVLLHATALTNEIAVEKCLALRTGEIEVAIQILPILYILYTSSPFRCICIQEISGDLGTVWRFQVDTTNMGSSHSTAACFALGSATVTRTSSLSNINLVQFASRPGR